MFIVILLINFSCDNNSSSNKNRDIISNTNIGTVNYDYEEFRKYIEENIELVEKNIKSREYENNTNPLFRDLDIIYNEFIIEASKEEADMSIRNIIANINNEDIIEKRKNSQVSILNDLMNLLLESLVEKDYLNLFAFLNFKDLLLFNEITKSLSTLEGMGILSGLLQQHYLYIDKNDNNQVDENDMLVLNIHKKKRDIFERSLKLILSNFNLGIIFDKAYTEKDFFIIYEIEIIVNNLLYKTGDYLDFYLLNLQKILNDYGINKKFLDEIYNKINSIPDEEWENYFSNHN
jgi:hypothetical protein